MRYHFDLFLQDEIISLPIAKIADDAEAIPVNEGDMKVEEVMEATTPGPGPAPSVQAQPLAPPQALFRPIDYPALHIFVSGAWTLFLQIFDVGCAFLKPLSLLSPCCWNHSLLKM